MCPTDGNPTPGAQAPQGARGLTGWLARTPRPPPGPVAVAVAAVIVASVVWSRPSGDSLDPSAVTFGFAHVDVMDLHVERLPGGSWRRREVLTPEQVAARFAIAQGAGARWDRWSLYWDLVEADGAFEWEVSDGMVARDVDHGLRPLVILQGTPRDYATSGVEGATYPPPAGVAGVLPPGPEQGVALQSSPPTGLYAPAFVDESGSGTDDPALAKAVNPANPWARFVDSAAGRYRPGGTLAQDLNWRAGTGVRTWEIGNEPNLRHFWSGTAADYARYLEVAYLVIKRQDPAAVVLHGGIADDAAAPSWFRSFLAALKARGTVSPLPAANGWYFDATAWHWYAYPDLLRSGPVRARQLLADAGLPPKPVWVTETGVPVWSEYPGPCWDPRSRWRGTSLEQAAYMWQAVSEAVASDIRVIIGFQLYDDCGNGPASYDAFGFVRNPLGTGCWEPPPGDPPECWREVASTAGTPRLALAALSSAPRTLEGASLLWRPARDPEGWQRVLFFEPPDRRVMVLWNQRRQAVEAVVAATGPRARLLRLTPDGVVSSTLEAVSGRYAVTLAGATNRNDAGGGALMAGAPAFIVERDAVAPFRAQAVSPPRDADGRFEVRVSAADGGTGVGQWRLWVAEDAPAGPGDWSVAAEGPWVGRPVADTVAVPFAGRPGKTYYFFAAAADRAGNWSASPGKEPQATTDVAPPAMSGAAYVPAALAAHVVPGRGATATATAKAVVTATTAATATATGTTAGSPTATPEPTMSPPATSTPGPTAAGPTAEAECTPVAVEVVGPRGDGITAPDGRWTLRAYAPGVADPQVGRRRLGEDGCVGFAPTRLEAYADVPGYVVFPPQDLNLSRMLALAVAPNRLANGGFEAGLAGWDLAGLAPPVVVADALAGSGALLLGRVPEGVSGSVDSGVAQVLRLPEREPILSMMLRFEAVQTCGPEGCAYDDRFDVAIQDLSVASQPVTLVTPPRGWREPEPRWRHLWYDLRPWAARSVRVTLSLHQGDALDPSRLWLDNLAAAEARP